MDQASPRTTKDTKAKIPSCPLWPAILALVLTLAKAVTVVTVR